MNCKDFLVDIQYIDLTNDHKGDKSGRFEITDTKQPIWDIFNIEIRSYGAFIVFPAEYDAVDFDSGNPNDYDKSILEKFSDDRYWQRNRNFSNNNPFASYHLDYNPNNTKSFELKESGTNSVIFSWMPEFSNMKKPNSVIDGILVYRVVHK